MNDNLLRAVCAVCAWGVGVLLLVLVAQVARSGAAELSWSLLVELPRDAGRGGGMASVLVSTFVVLGVAVVAAVPVGLGTAVWLAEFPGRAAGLVRGSLDVLATVPSIVLGLFGMAFFSELLGLDWSLASGGLTVAVMILPLFARLAEEALRAVPQELRQTGAALGLDRTQLLLPIVLPGALPGLCAALVLSIGRVLAESAALMFTAGTSLRMPLGLGDPGRVLALHVYTLAVDVPGGQARSAAAALLLFAVIGCSTALAWALPGLLRRWLQPC